MQSWGEHLWTFPRLPPAQVSRSPISLTKYVGIERPKTSGQHAPVSQLLIIQTLQWANRKITFGELCGRYTYTHWTVFSWCLREESFVFQNLELEMRPGRGRTDYTSFFSAGHINSNSILFLADLFTNYFSAALILCSLLCVLAAVMHKLPCGGIDKIPFYLKQQAYACLFCVITVW